MPQKTRRRRRSPVSFSPFGRSMALLYPTKKMKPRIWDSVLKDKFSAPFNSGNGVVKDSTFENHEENSDSSDDGEFEPTEELQKSFDFKSYLMISKIYKHKKSAKKIGICGDGEEAIIFSKPEDGIFYQLSFWSFSFPLQTQQVTTDELKDYRPMGLVMAVDASKVGLFRKQLHSLIDDKS